MTAAPAFKACSMQGMEARNAGVFGDLAVVVLRDVQVGTDEDALASNFAGSDQVGEAKDVHESL